MGPTTQGTQKDRVTDWVSEWTTMPTNGNGAIPNSQNPMGTPAKSVQNKNLDCAITIVPPFFRICLTSHYDRDRKLDGKENGRHFVLQEDIHSFSSDDCRLLDFPSKDKAKPASSLPLFSSNLPFFFWSWILSACSLCQCSIWWIRILIQFRNNPSPSTKGVSELCIEWIVPSER